MRRLISVRLPVPTRARRRARRRISSFSSSVSCENRLPFLDAVLVGRQERIDQRGQKADLPPAVEQDRQADQAPLAPAVDRLGRDVQLLADLFQRQHRLGHVLNGQGRHRVGQFRQEQTQIVNDVAADDQQVGMFIGAKSVIR